MERQQTVKLTKTNSTSRDNPQPKPAPNKLAPSHPVLQLQRKIGNQAVHRLLSSGGIQAKLTISQPGDQYEQEADRVADQVMRMPDPSKEKKMAISGGVQPLRIQRVCSGCEEELRPQPEEEEPVQTKPLVGQITPLVQRQVEEEEEEPFQAKLISAYHPTLQRQEDIEEEEENLQAKSLSGEISPLIQRQDEPEEEGEEEALQAKEASGRSPAVSAQLEASIHAQSSGGQPLPVSTRAFFEPRFGTDFSQVRVHTDSQGAETTNSIQAKAFTFGRNIAFGPGQYAPESHEGQRLLAHELTHVVQQGSADNHLRAQPLIQKTLGYQVMRSLAFESTVKICRRVLVSRNFTVSQGGLRVVLLLNPLDTEIPNCENHKFWVTLTKSVDWGFDDEIATCEGETGGTRSFSFANIPAGTYYLTINRVFDHPYCCIEGDILVFDEPISGDSSHCERDEDPSAMDIVHGALDIAGFIPVLGAIPDGINAAIYVVEGDWANAGLSAVAMVPAWGDGVKLGAMAGKAGKSVIQISKKATIKLGEEGIAKGLKEVKAASKATHAAEDAAKAAKLEKEAAEKLEKEAAEKKSNKKKDEKEGRKGKWGCQDVRCNVYKNLQAKPPNENCPDRVIGAAPYIYPSFDAACKAAQVAANLLVPRGCIKRHCNCKTKCTKK